MVWVPGFLVFSMGSLLLFLLVLVLCLHVHIDNLRYVLLHCQHWCLVLSAWSNASLCRLWLSTVEKFVLHLPQRNGLFIFQYIKVFGVECVYPAFFGS